MRQHVLKSAIATMALTIAASVTATAQNADIEKAINRMKESSYVTTSTVSNTVDGKDNKPVNYARYDFTVPKKDKSLVTQLEKAFKAGRKNAYYAMFQEKDADNYRRVSIALPTGGSIIAGRDDDYYSRVLCYKDPSDKNYRYSYVLEWTDDDADDDGYTGFVAQVYGKNDRKYTFTLPSIDKNGNITTSKHTMTVSKDGKTNTLVIDNDGNITQISGNDTVKVNGMSINIPKISTYNTADDILQKFGFYRQQILSHPSDTTALNLYANQMYKLCKKATADGSLNETERKICAKELRSLLTKIKDSFTNALIEQAANLLESGTQGA